MLAASVTARLGEDRPQCDRRYGSPVETKSTKHFGGASVVAYKEEAVRITITFVAGRAEGLEYKTAKPLSVDEVDGLLELNRQGFAWHRRDKAEGPFGSWARSDGGDAEYSRLPTDSRNKFVLHIRSGELVRLAALPPPTDERRSGFSVFDDSRRSHRGRR
jgi:hypothetical protein